MPDPTYKEPRSNNQIPDEAFPLSKASQDIKTSCIADLLDAETLVISYRDPWVGFRGLETLADIPSYMSAALSTDPGSPPLYPDLPGFLNSKYPSKEISFEERFPLSVGHSHCRSLFASPYQATDAVLFRASFSSFHSVIVVISCAILPSADSSGISTIGWKAKDIPWNPKSQMWLSHVGTKPYIKKGHQARTHPKEFGYFSRYPVQLKIPEPVNCGFACPRSWYAHTVRVSTLFFNQIISS
ncbi:hypothetical protein CIRG_06221 [Coccidioides immitis RMSCC 2394]|uniref:Uncharacterized protein n=1 Tax=Coccidioides immitis RMSCC 2394 TaxID=404692 RepID=A0A0J6YFV2_COCIT|nr:hypothetical protein CIRG_06221 [Coccidioides immitis RMSCC 2394]